MDKEKVYSKEYLTDLDDSTLLSILKREWVNPSSAKISVWGRLEVHKAPSGRFFYNLFNVRSVVYNQSIEYPFGAERKISKSGIYVHSSADEYFRGYSFPVYVRCDVKLNDREERLKHSNPLEVCVVHGSIEALTGIPFIDKDEIVGDDSSSYISEVIHDFYFRKHESAIKSEVKDIEKALMASLEEKEKDLKQSYEADGKRFKTLQNKLLKNKKILEKKSSEHDQLVEIIGDLSEKKLGLKDHIKTLVNKKEKVEIDMSVKMERLNSYIRDKADLLKDLEFLDEEEYDDLLLNREVSSVDVQGISFSEAMDSDYSKAVSYIQAFLMGKQVLYQRHVIENFFTLIRSNDLIVLAGDSGSGKTNLVESFAEAIGGVSKIIPVKPNWTSSEDLLGYYNPLEKKYLATPFLEALIEAKNNPNVPYLICLDEMNLARVEYYFADFLSKLEQRGKAAEIELYSGSESAHILSELRSVIEIIVAAKEKYKKNNIVDFVKLLQDEDINEEIKRTFGFSDKDSLIKYHGDLRRMLAGVIDTPPSITFPPNVRIIGTVNIDETTHYLSPKILDRAHIMKFSSPLLTDWGEIRDEVNGYELDDVSASINFEIDELGSRAAYPPFDPDDKFCKFFVDMNRDFFSPMGVEFGLRTIRQGLNYIRIFKDFNSDDDVAVNNFMLHKVLPKFSFDGSKKVNGAEKYNLLYGVQNNLEENLDSSLIGVGEFSAKLQLEKIIAKAESNDWIVNYWS